MIINRDDDVKHFFIDKYYRPMEKGVLQAWNLLITINCLVKKHY
jgi:hypothetical protein